MFGYIAFNADQLSKDRQQRYRSYYCGLCHTLREKYGLLGSATLSYDMTFLAVLLHALYESEERMGEERCLPHPVRRHEYLLTPELDYVADINIALAYHKCLDNWRDDRRVISAAEERLLRRAYSQIAQARPDACQTIEEWLTEINRIELDDLQEIDVPLNATGKVLGKLFAYPEDGLWADTLYQVGDGIGRFIYMMDAYEDLPGDVRHKRYNPLKGLSTQNDFEEICRSALMMAAGDAAQAFELLPIVEDADILRSILYSGIWVKYIALQKKRTAKAEEHDHAGSL